MIKTLPALLLAASAAAQLNPRPLPPNPAPSSVASLTGTTRPVGAGGIVTVKGVITGNRNGFAVPGDYAKAVIGVYVGGSSAGVDFPVRWDRPLPAVLNAGERVSFTADVPADRLILRCAPRAKLICEFDAQGPFAAGRFRDPNTDLDMARAEVFVEESAAAKARWSAPRVADKGRFANAPGARRYEAGTLLVGYPQGVSLADVERLVAAAGYKIRSVSTVEPVAIGLVFPPDVTIEDAYDLIAPNARYAQPNYIMTLNPR